MYDFFLCLFLFPYYLYKFLKDCNGIDRANAKQKRYEDRRNKWLDSITDYELEKRMRKNMIEHSDDYTLDDEFIDAVKMVPGLLNITNKKDEDIPIIKKIGLRYAILILMANRGKMPRYEADFGVNGNLMSNRVGVPMKDVKTVAYLMWWINTKLIEHGVNERLVMKEGNTTVYIVDNLDKCVEIRGGIYTWEPNVLEFLIDEELLTSKI